MKEKTISEINEIYDLEIDRVIENIKLQKEKAGSAKAEGFFKVLLQFPEGLKPYALAICSFIENKTNCRGFIWMDTCFGACDLPLETERLGIDLIIQFGHSKWGYGKDKNIVEL